MSTRKDDKPALVIASLEALAILLALKAVYGETPPEERSTVQVPDLDRQQGERFDPEQVDVYALSGKRHIDGAGSTYEGDGAEDGGELDATRGKSRGRRLSEWGQLWF